MVLLSLLQNSITDKREKLFKQIRLEKDRRVFEQSRLAFYILAIILLSSGASPGVQAEGLPGASSSFSPTNLVAQTVPPQFIPTDITPFTIAPERNKFSPNYKFRLFQVLPERLWFNFTTEVSQRLDTNALFTYSRPKADYAFRVLPDLTVGYELFKNTSIYADYFVIKDVFARNYSGINFFPTTQSVSLGIRHVKQFSEKTNLQCDFQARELWQTTHLHQFDFLPSITLTHVFTPHHIVFASTLLQLRGGNYFVAPTREIDPFYTIGYIYRRGQWTFVANDTLVTNFRRPPFNDAIPNQSNMSMIADLELNHPVCKKFAGLLAFVRAEPVWNWDSNKVAGISGFDFRLYGGLRLSMNKPSYYGAIDNLHKKVMSHDQLQSNNTQSISQISGNNGDLDSVESSQSQPPIASDNQLLP